jgi:hypothetical protein
LVLRALVVLVAVPTQQRLSLAALVVSPEAVQAAAAHPSQAALLQQAEQEGRAS